MSAHSSQVTHEPVHFSEYGIPIRNLWHMLLYAWDEIPIQKHWMLADAEGAPTLDALLATILMKLMRARLSIGLGREYVDEEGTLQGIRGRINFADSLKRRTFERGQASCAFETYSANEPRNQIIRTTLARLIQTGQFGPEAESANQLRQNLRRLARSLDGIDLIELTPDLIHRQQLGRQDRDYRLMLSICALILQRQMPTESVGDKHLPTLDHDALVLFKVYERFVANFYRIHLQEWDVFTQKRLEWHEKQANKYLPSMKPDLVLQERSSSRLIILDTKFTAHSFIENQWGREIFDSSHLYQLYAYLKSQEHLSDAHRTGTGILLYPAVNHSFSERIELQDHIMRVESVDLAAPWWDVERHLLELVHNSERDT